MAWKVDWVVTIDGRDVSSAMRPFLHSITVSDKDGTSSDTCNLIFDDTGGQCLLPKPGAKVVVRLQGAVVFQGVVDTTPWTMTRGGGRILEVTAKGVDTRGKAKESQRWHLDDSTLQDALTKAGKAAGITSVTVDPELGSIERPYWSPDGMSFLAWGQKLAKEHGATFKVRGEKAVFAKRGTGVTATGSSMPTITASIPGNVISVSIDPSKGRPKFKKTKVRYFDRPSASYKEKELDIETGDDTVEAENSRITTAADETEADSMTKGRKSDSERDAGGGTIEVDLAEEAQAEGTLILTGARPGIDGTYRIAGVTHKATRSGGATTTIDLKQPTGGAGTDSRASANAGAATAPANVPIPTPASR